METWGHHRARFAAGTSRGGSSAKIDMAKGEVMTPINVDRHVNPERTG